MIKGGRGKLQVCVVQTLLRLSTQAGSRERGRNLLSCITLQLQREEESQEKAVKGQSALLPFAHTLPLPSCPVLACSPR